MNKIISHADQLNRVLAFYNCDEDEIDTSSYYASKLKCSEAELLGTKCSSTVKLIQYLFNMSDSILVNELTNCCVVELGSTNIDSPSHIFTYIDNVIYHSYAMKYKLIQHDVNRDILWGTINKFIAHPNIQDWEQITGARENNFEGKYKILIWHYNKYDKNKIWDQALLLLENSLVALQGGKLKEHLYDDYTYILSFREPLIENGIIFINELKHKLNF